MSEINIMLKVTRQQQVEIEEFCINKGLNITQYFMKLHEDFKAKCLGTPRNWVDREEAEKMFPRDAKDVEQEQTEKKAAEAAQKKDIREELKKKKSSK